MREHDVARRGAGGSARCHVFGAGRERGYPRVAASSAETRTEKFLHYVLFALSNLHITPDVRRDLVYAASARGCLYRSPLAIIAQAIRAILLASAMAATLVGRRASNAVSQGRCLVPWILA